MGVGQVPRSRRPGALSDGDSSTRNARTASPRWGAARRGLTLSKTPGYEQCMGNRQLGRMGSLRLLSLLLLPWVLLTTSACGAEAVINEDPVSDSGSDAGDAGTDHDADEDAGADADAGEDGGTDGGAADSGMSDEEVCEAAKAARAALVIGTYRPDETTTGPLPCVTLTRHDGDLRVDAANTVIEGIDLHGSLVLGRTATNVVVRHSIIRGQLPSPTQETAIRGGGTATTFDRLGLVIEDSRIDLTGRENWFHNNINGANFTLRRTELLRGVDGVGLVSEGGNVRIEGCYLHHGYWTSWTADTPEPKPGHSDMQTHTDGIQFHRGRGYVVRGNFIGGERRSSPGTGGDFANAGMMIAQEVDTSAANRLDDVLIEKNWLQGGAATINLAYARNNDLSGVTIRDNRFLRGSGYYILQGAGTAPVLSNNVFDDTGLPVTVTNRN